MSSAVRCAADGVLFLIDLPWWVSLRTSFVVESPSPGSSPYRGPFSRPTVGRQRPEAARPVDSPYRQGCGVAVISPRTTSSAAGPLSCASPPSVHTPLGAGAAASSLPRHGGPAWIKGVLAPALRLPFRLVVRARGADPAPGGPWRPQVGAAPGTTARRHKLRFRREARFPIVRLSAKGSEERPPAMACRGFFECVLKLLNLVVMAVGLAMVGYGAYLLVMWLQAAPLPPPSPSPAAVSPSADLVRLGRPLLLLVVDASLPDGTAERLSSAWNRYRQIVHLKRVALYSHLLGPMESMRSPKTRSTGLLR